MQCPFLNFCCFSCVIKPCVVLTWHFKLSSFSFILLSTFIIIIIIPLPSGEAAFSSARLRTYVRMYVTSLQRDPCCSSTLDSINIIIIIIITSYDQQTNTYVVIAHIQFMFCVILIMHFFPFRSSVTLSSYHVHFNNTSDMCIQMFYCMAAKYGTWLLQTNIK